MTESENVDTAVVEKGLSEAPEGGAEVASAQEAPAVETTSDVSPTHAAAEAPARDEGATGGNAENGRLEEEGEDGGAEGVSGRGAATCTEVRGAREALCSTEGGGTEHVASKNAHEEQGKEGEEGSGQEGGSEAALEVVQENKSGEGASEGEAKADIVGHADVVVGCLQKKGEIGLLGLMAPGFKDRWVRLREGFLTYHATEEDAQKGYNPLHGNFVELSRYAVDDLAPEPTQLRIMPLSTHSSAAQARHWEFRAKSEAQRDQWVHDLTAHGCVTMSELDRVRRETKASRK
jgi:hypothetical protein